MVARVQTVAFQGIEAVPVDVQAQIAPGLRRLHHRRAARQGDQGGRRAGSRRAAVLRPEPAAQAHRREPRSRRSAQGGQPLRSADRARADGASIGAFPADALDGYVALGELGLDGRLAPTSGVLPAAIAAHARDLGIVCPAPSGPEAAWAGDDIEIIAPDSLLALVNHLGGYQLCAASNAEASRDHRRPA